MILYTHLKTHLYTKAAKPAHSKSECSQAVSMTLQCERSCCLSDSEDCTWLKYVPSFKQPVTVVQYIVNLILYVAVDGDDILSDEVSLSFTVTPSHLVLRFYSVATVTVNLPHTYHLLPLLQLPHHCSVFAL